MDVDVISVSHNEAQEPRCTQGVMAADVVDVVADGDLKEVEDIFFG